MARPKLQIDWQQVGEMLKCGSSATSIAIGLGISTDTLYVRSKSDLNLDFSAFSQQKKAQGNDLLRQKQFELAMSGNVPMLIWLGKNRLGQADKQEVKTVELKPVDDQKNDRLRGFIYIAKNTFEEYELNPEGLTFDDNNPDHRANLKKWVRHLIEGNRTLFPIDDQYFGDWEVRFDKILKLEANDNGTLQM